MRASGGCTSVSRYAPAIRSPVSPADRIRVTRRSSASAPAHCRSSSTSRVPQGPATLARSRATALNVRRRSCSGVRDHRGNGGSPAAVSSGSSRTSQAQPSSSARRCAGVCAWICRSKASTRGAKGVCPPRRWQPPLNTRRPAPWPRAAASCSRRVLPMPGSPARSNNGGPSPARWRASSASSWLRPTNGGTAPSGAAGRGKDQAQAPWAAARRAARSREARVSAVANCWMVAGCGRRRPRSSMLM